MSNSNTSSIALGSYQLCERIDEGGSCQVYRAKDTKGRSYALKMLGPHSHLDGESAAKRLDHELKILRGIEHANLVRYVDHGSDAELGPYLVMDYVPGANLRHTIDAGICPEAVLLLVRQIAEALVCLHGQSLVHRDLKPENIVATPDGDIVVVDLGLALLGNASRHTEEGHIVGSIPYMAPEQLDGVVDIGPEVDIWAVGVMAYEWLSGRRPFARERPSEEAAAALIGRYTPVDAIDRRPDQAFATLLTRALAANPTERPTASELLALCEQQLDWLDKDSRRLERAALVSEPAAYQDRVVGYRVRRCLREAEDALTKRAPFVALRCVDRGLAYAPEDAELLAMAARAERASAEPASAEPPRRAPSNLPVAGPITPKPSRWAFAGALTVAAVLTVGLGAFALWPSTKAPPPTSAAPAINDSAALELAGGLVGVFQSFAVIEKEKAAEQALLMAPIAGLHAIDHSHMSNRETLYRPRATDTLSPLPRLVWAMNTLRSFNQETKKKSDTGDIQAVEMLHILDLWRTSKQEAEAALDTMLETHPEHATTWLAKALFRARRLKDKDAVHAFGKTLTYQVNNVVALTGRGILGHRLGNVRDAYYDLHRAITLDAQNLDALIELFIIYRRYSQDEDALLIFDYVCSKLTEHPDFERVRIECR